MTDRVSNRGAKTAMTLALRRPDAIKDLVSVDNAPIDARLESDFARYTRGMRKVDEVNVTKLGDADKILQDYEEVCRQRLHPHYSFA
jgi:hypothetical protein